MVGRVLVLLGALVVAAIGAGLVLLYASQARVAAARELELVNVYVAQRDVEAGASIASVLADQSIMIEQLPRNALIPGVIRVDETPLTAEQQAQFLTGPLSSSQQVTADDIGSVVVALDDELGLLGSERNAISITLGDEQRVAPFLDPGENIALLLTYVPEGATTPCTQLLVSSIKVLAIGDRVGADLGSPATPQGEAPAAGTLLTLEVTRDTLLAARIRHATTLGGLSAVLLDEGTSQRPEDCVGVKQLFDQDPPTQPEEPGG